MVNREKFIKRLRRILSHYGLSAAAFADRIEVQRSSISHLLSGRNKPSLDFVLKVVQTFPEVNLYWLLNGQGSFPNTVTQSEPLPASSKSLISQPDLKSNDMADNTAAERAFKKDTQTAVLEKEPGILLDHENEEIDKIIIFYKQGHCKVYTP